MEDLVAKHNVIQSDNERLSDYLIDKLEELPSRKAVKKAILKKRVLLNGNVAYTGDHVKTGDIIELLGDPFKVVPFDLQLEVVFENENYAVVFKPSGLKVSGNEHRNFQNALPNNLKRSGEKDALKIPRPCHRLDMPTSGLILVAKTYSFLRYALDLFEHRGIQKRYEAIVVGEIDEEGEVNEEVDGKASKSIFKKKGRIESVKNGVLSWLDLYPKTGRKHQLRKHMLSLSCPILGDQLYDLEGKLKHKGLFLCAVELSFKDQDGELKNHRVDAPEKFNSLWDREKRWIERMGLKNRLIEILKNDSNRMEALKVLSEVYPDSYISAGFIRNMVWDNLHGIQTELEDVDVIYLDEENQDKELDLTIEKKLTELLPQYNWSVKNQSRMASKHGHNLYQSIKEAMSFWPETATSIAVRFVDGEIELIYSSGLEDLFEMRVSKNEKANEEVYLERLEKKKWKEKWGELEINRC